MVYSLKQNGHPVSPRGNNFVTEQINYLKEACDVRNYYSTLFPLSSNQNYKSTGLAQCQRGSHPGSTRQALSTNLSMLWSKSFRYPQLDSAHDSRFEPGQRKSLDYLSVSQAVLCQMPSDLHRRFEPVSSLSAGDPPAGALYSPSVSVYDGHRCRPAHGTGLENSEKHRQMVFRTSIRPTRLRRVASFGSGRNIGQKRPPLLDRGLGLSQRPCGLCWQRSQIQNIGNIFQSIEPRSARLN
jgi:hypothetical protein